ncbi:hypothetical protein COF68_05095 [Bacillus toyonensis]|uniref:hypothetical protein n=1 Tax=Bacillus toyonensis TaxID=155322 RepID=UPI000BFB2E82|nr:hypothetical protein [Bacillus toyonensis]PHE64223.1 hypothetical protein COF68_05095 [Bacillus toyonensis]
MLKVNFISVKGSTTLMVTVHNGNNNLVLDLGESLGFDDWCDVLGIKLPDIKLETKTSTVVIEEYVVDRIIQTKEFSDMNELPKGVKPCLNKVLRKEGGWTTELVLSYVLIEEQITTVYKPVKKTEVYVLEHRIPKEERELLPQVFLTL